MERAGPSRELQALPADLMRRTWAQLAPLQAAFLEALGVGRAALGSAAAAHPSLLAAGLREQVAALRAMGVPAAELGPVLARHPGLVAFGPEGEARSPSLACIGGSACCVAQSGARCRVPGALHCGCSGLRPSLACSPRMLPNACGQGPRATCTTPQCIESDYECVCPCPPYLRDTAEARQWKGSSVSAGTRLDSALARARTPRPS